MSKNGNRSDEYEVGYGKAPLDTRFKKGQSGNPNGRPRIEKREIIMRKEDIDGLFLAKMKEPTTFKKNGEIVTQPYIFALFDSLKADALKGNRFARKFLLELLLRLMDERYKDKVNLVELLLDHGYTSDEVLEQIWRVN